MRILRNPQQDSAWDKGGNPLTLICSAIPLDTKTMWTSSSMVSKRKKNRNTIIKQGNEHVPATSLAGLKLFLKSMRKTMKNIKPSSIKEQREGYHQHSTSRNSCNLINLQRKKLITIKKERISSNKCSNNNLYCKNLIHKPNLQVSTYKIKVINTPLSSKC